MTHAPEPPIQSPLGPPPPVYPAATQHSRLYRAAAWVVIVAGILFVLSVVFFAGVKFSEHGQPYRHHHHGMFGPDGPVGPAGPDGPRGWCSPEGRSRRVAVPVVRRGAVRGAPAWVLAGPAVMRVPAVTVVLRRHRHRVPRSPRHPHRPTPRSVDRGLSDCQTRCHTCAFNWQDRDL